MTTANETPQPSDTPQAAKDDFIEKLKKELDEWRDKLTQLEAKANSVQADVKQQYDTTVADLRQKAQEGEKKVNELTGASASAWQDLQKGAEEAWKSLADSFKQASSRF